MLRPLVSRRRRGGVRAAAAAAPFGEGDESRRAADHGGGEASKQEGQPGSAPVAGGIGNAPTQRKGEQLPLPRVKTRERAGELFRRDHATVA